MPCTSMYENTDAVTAKLQLISTSAASAHAGNPPVARPNAARGPGPGHMR
jgi:hypothetical protein